MFWGRLKMSHLKKIILFLVLVGLQYPLFAVKSSNSFSEKKAQFIKQFSGKFGYNEADLVEIFKYVKPNKAILEKISHPAEKRLSWSKYKQIFLDNARIEGGVKFYYGHYKVLQEAYDKYGVPPSIIVAILGVETRYGAVMGNDSVIQAISTIVFSYPKREKYFTKELQAFLKLAKQENFNPLSLKGSYAGAMGMAQFMPSSYLNFAIDYNGDGKSDLWHTPADAIFSIANYLQKNGWQRDLVIVDDAVMAEPYSGKQNHKPFTTLSSFKQLGIDTKNVIVELDTPVGFLSLEGDKKKLNFITFKNFSVITTYNGSPLYAMAVFELAKSIESKL